MTDLERDVLAHLHANSATRIDDVAAAIGEPADDVRAAVERLVAAGHLEREGDRLVPDPAARPSPGLFVANERTDAQPVERDRTAESP